MMMLSFLYLLLNLALSYASPETTYTSSKIVDLPYASYRGNTSFANTAAFLGIPYAEPPLGDLRFRAPVPLNTTRLSEQFKGHVVDAMSYPNFCIQGTIGDGKPGGAGTEDCLHVNIYTPADAKQGDNLPVLFYIHGGGYVYGNPRNWPFDTWIMRSPNVVIVSVYYRLDSFGFLATPEFADHELGDFNAGFRDQIQALKWIKEYISYFGGNPNQVTINGQSAGASSVELHMVANEGEQLFHAGIAQSVDRTPLPTPEQQQPLFDFYASYAGCGEGNVSTQMACLRNASVSALAPAQDAAVMGAFDGLYNTFHPVLDGELFTDWPTRLFLQGQFTHVPLMVGSTSNETLSGGVSIPEALQAFFPSLTPEDLAEFAYEYPITEFDSASQQFQVATGESELICGREALGGAASQYAKAWTYRYNQPNPTSGSDAVSHAAENWMMFLGTNTGDNGTTTFTPQTPVELAFASELIAYWLSFVRSGDPNTYKLSRSPTWEPYTETSKVRIVLQQDPQNITTLSGSYMETQPEPETQRCQFVISKIAHEQN